MNHQEVTLGSCSACGTSPINHTLFRLTDFFGTYLISPVNSITRKLPRGRLWHALEDVVMHALLHILIFFRVLTFNTNPAHAKSGRSQLIWLEARRRGIEMEQLLFFKKPIEFYRARIGGKWIYFESIPIPPPHTETYYETRVDDKYLLAESLRSAGVPAPQAHTALTLRDAQKHFDALTKPVIVKPRSGSRGRHTTTHITTPEELEAAFRLCRRIAAKMVIEEHLFGSVYRGTVIGGKMVGFFKADPPRVIGDGIHTIAELIENANRTRPERLEAIRLTEDTRSFLHRLGLTPGSIPNKGAVVDLSAKTGRFYGGYTEEMFEKVHPEFAPYFEKAAEVLNAPVIGFDAIIEDPTRSPASQRWGIIEGNSLPFIDLHYYAYAGKTRDLAPYIWDLWK